MTVVVVNWQILLAIPEKSHNFFSLKGGFVWSPHWVMIARRLLGEGTCTAVSIYERPIFVEDLVGPKPLRNKQPLVHTMDRCQKNGAWLVTKAPLFLCFFQIVGLPCQTWYLCRSGGANIWLNSQFSRKMSICFYNYFCHFKCWKYCFQA